MTTPTDTCTPALLDRLAAAERLWLFLDYDGTLADFAATPEYVEPDPTVVGLVARLAASERIRVAVISGRRLDHVQKLLPVPGILLAGAYGVELQTPTGDRIDRVPYSTIRPTLDLIKPRWEKLIAGREGFFLEDKGWALALHARFADDVTAQRVLVAANRIVSQTPSLKTGRFRLLGGHKFMEIGPSLGNKGLAVEYILENAPWPDALPVYLGDDDKDEEAFRVVKGRGGVAIVIANAPRATAADCRLASPQAARWWLERVLARFEET